MHMRRVGVLLFSFFLMLAVNVHAQWVMVGGSKFPDGFPSNTAYGIPWYADASSSVYSRGWEGIFRFTDSASTWIPLGIKDSTLDPILVTPETTTSSLPILYAGCAAYLQTPQSPFSPSVLISFGILRSVDNGVHWTPANRGIPKDQVGLLPLINAFVVRDSTIFVGTSAGVFHSTDRGDSWTSNIKTLTSPMLGADIQTLIAGPALDNEGHRYLFAKAQTRVGLLWWRSGDDGSTWSAISGFKDSDVLSYAVGASAFYLLTDQGLFLGTAEGNSWVSLNPPGHGEVTGIAANGTKTFVARNRFSTGASGVGGGGVYMSGDNGSSWLSIGDGLPGPLYSTRLFVNGRYLYADVDTSGVWRRPLSTLLTSADDSPRSDLPKTIMLDQNYPNPFNPATTVSFSLPSQSSVSLKVFDALGREVATLASEEMSAGNHSMRWDASKVPSGIYYYRLRAGVFTETRKAVLIK